ncbi:kinase-like protein [Atractiella rhizophila]|nr:kinase-like protein [Atractiella rhizophila]
MKALRFYDIWDHVPSNSGRSGGCLKFDSDGLSYADYSTLKDRQVDWLVNSSDLKGIHFERENGKILHVTFLRARQITFQCFWGFQESASRHQLDLPRLTQFCSEHWQIVATVSSEFHALNLPTLYQSRLRRSRSLSSLGQLQLTREGHSKRINIQHWLPATSTTNYKRDILFQIEHLQEINLRGGCSIFRLGDRAVKCTLNSQKAPFEASAMEFVRSQTTIPIPRVYAAFVHENNSYIVMDFVENDPLESFYPDYLKTSVASVHEFVNFLVDCKRQLVELGHSYTTDPPFSSWSGEAYNNRIFDPPLTRTLHLYEQFQDYWKDQWDIPHNPFLEMPRSLLEFSTSPPSAVLCHGDLVADNVLVKDGKAVAIIDWDTLGFYPHFWEAGQAVKLMLSKETPVLTAFVDDALGSQEEQEIKDWVQVCQKVVYDRMSSWHGRRYQDGWIPRYTDPSSITPLHLYS